MSILQPQAAAATVSRQSGSHPQRYLRSESAFAVIWKAMRIYIRHFGVLLLTFALPTLPFDILALAGLREGEGTLAITAAIGSLLAAIFALSAVCVVGSDICMGNKPSLRRAYRRIFGPPFAYVVLNSLMVFLCLCSVPLLLFTVIGIMATSNAIFVGCLVIGTMPVSIFIVSVVALHVMYVPAISALEMKPGFLRALNRSSLLGRGRRIRSFVVLAVIAAFSSAATFILMTLAFALALPAGLYWSLSLRLFLPLFAIASLLMYYDLRSRKEAFDFPCRDESIHD